MALHADSCHVLGRGRGPLLLTRLPSDVCMFAQGVAAIIVTLVTSGCRNDSVAVGAVRPRAAGMTFCGHSKARMLG
eukprot:6020243-Amphidinium_carterae.3